MNKPIFWHQGLFLQPQHFQLDDLYLKSLSDPFHKFMRPHFRGVGNIEFSKVISGNSVEKPHKGEFLFEDMTYVVYPDNALMEARPFEEDWVEGGKPFNIYIGLKKFNKSGENVTIISKPDNLAEISTRFVAFSDPEESPDLHQSGPPAQVKHLYYLLKLFWESEKDQLGDYTLIPYLKLERMGEEIVVSENFIPPCLGIGSSETLTILMKEIKDQITSRGRQLESYKKERGIHTAEFGARDMVYLLALRSLNRYVPVLSHIMESKNVHPWVAYGILKQLIGELTSFSENINVHGEEPDGTPLLLSYDHERLWECFSGAKALITRLLDEITAGPEYVIPLIYDGTYYTAELPPAIFEGKNRFYLVLGTQADPNTILKTIEIVAKLSSREFLPLLIARALPGIKLEHLSTPPQELPRRAHSIYFQIDHHSEKWAQVESGKNLALYWDQAPEDLSVELMVVGRT